MQKKRRTTFIALGVGVSLSCLLLGLVFGFGSQEYLGFGLLHLKRTFLLLSPKPSEFCVPFEFSYNQTRKLISAGRPRDALLPVIHLWFDDFHDNQQGAQILVRQEKLRRVLAELCLAMNEPERAHYVQVAPFGNVYRSLCYVDSNLEPLLTYKQYLSTPWSVIFYRPNQFEFRIERGPAMDVNNYHPLFPKFVEAFGTFDESSEKTIGPIDKEIIDKLNATPLADKDNLTAFEKEILNFQFQN